MVQGPRGQAPAPAARSGLEAPAIRGSDGLWLVRQLVPAARPGRRAHLTAQGGVFCSALGNNILPLKPEEHSERRTHTIRFTQKSLSFFGKRCKASRAASLCVTKCLTDHSPGVRGGAWELGSALWRKPAAAADSWGLHRPPSIRIGEHPNIREPSCLTTFLPETARPPKAPGDWGSPRPRVQG